MINKVLRNKVDVISTKSYLKSPKEIESEPMLFGASWQWALDNGGPITLDIMHEIQRDVLILSTKQALKGYHPVIDTKSVMLMPGWCPCIPGWHCDGVIRETPKSQPDLDSLCEDVFHYTSYVSSVNRLAPTEFIYGPQKLSIDPKQVWGSVTKQIKEDDERIMSYPSGVINRFTRDTLHRGTFSKERGWRYFFRLSFYHMPSMNLKRNQVQVYPKDSRGW